MLFSAAPVEAPDEANPEPEPAEERVIVTVEAATVAAINLQVSELEDDPDGILASELSIRQAEADTALTLSQTDISNNQNVTLVNVNGVSAGLNQATLDAIAAAAAQRWIDSGELSDDQVAALGGVTYEIGNLPAARLGSVNGNTISVDGDAWGRGWFLDATPFDDGEFGTLLGSGALSAAGGLDGRFDLLTVVLHEQGHVLGLTDLLASGSASGNVMATSISAGTRLLPAPGQAAGAIPGIVAGSEYATMTFQVLNTNNAGADSLRQAILDANANPGADFIEFAGGGIGTISLSTGQLTITDDVTINSTAVGGVTINNTLANTRVFEVQGSTVGRTVLFDTLTISGGQDNSVGGGVYINGKADVTFDTVLLTNNSATEGGGFYVAGGAGAKVTLVDSGITNNTAATRGGGFRNSAFDTVVTMTNGQISGNTANNEHGGGFYNNGTVTLSNTDVFNNEALDLDNANRRDSQGGGFYNGSGTVNLLNGSDVLGNTVYGFGGGFRNVEGVVNATGSKIDGNKLVMFSTSTRHGGGFWNGSDGVVNLTDTVISSNETGKDTPLGTAGTRLRGVGGGFWNTDGATVNIDGDSQITGNQAEDGGGFYNTSTGSTVNITGTAGNPIEVGTLADPNFARVRGGGFRTTGNTNVNLSYVTIEGNSVETERGGGFYADGAQITGSNVTVQNNKTTAASGNRQGGGGWISSFSVVKLTDSLVQNNETSQNGGGFYVENATLDLNNTQISNNFSQNSGGGAMFTGSSILNAVDSSISDNIARDHGGGFYITDDARATVTRTHVDGNLAGYESDGVTQREAGAIGADLRGGGFRALGRAQVTLIDSTLSSNEAARYGGGFDAENEPQVTLIRSTMADNVADNHGGGGRVATNAKFVAINSTISGNYAGFSRAENGGSIVASSTNAVGGGFWQQGGNGTDLNQVTVTDNKTSRGGTDAGGGFYRGAGTVTVENSIIFGNIGDFDDVMANWDATDIRGSAVLAGGNVIGVQGNGTLTGNLAGKISTDPNLAALAANGGFADTHAITGASSAAGLAGISTRSVDQRGAGRPGTGSDVGAFEADPLATVLNIDAVLLPENAISGSAFDVEVVATTTGAGPLTTSWSVDAPAGGQLATGSGLSTSLTATNPATDPVQTVVVTVTVTDTSTGQSASESRNVVLVDPLAMPTSGTGSAVVTTAADGGAGSLRDAIQQANGSAAGTFVITFAAGINPTLSITGSDNNANTGDLDITKTNGAVSIVGNAGPNTIIDAAGVDRVFDVRPGATAYFTNLEITGGETGGSDDHGAGLRILGATAVFKDVDIVGNNAIRNDDNVGGAIYTTSSGIMPSQIYMTRGSVSGNVADSHGGGFYMAGTNVGKSFLHLTDTVVDGNVASNSAGIRTDRDGGGFYITDDGNRVVLNNVTVSNNRTDGTAGSDGGGALFTGADNVIEINGGTWTGNMAGRNADTGGTGDNDGGGFMVEGTRQTITLDGVTFGGELAGGADALGFGTARGGGNLSEDDGGGFYMQGQFNTVNLIDTHIVGNQANDTGGGFFIANNTETVNISQTKFDGGGLRNNFSDTEHGGGFRNDGIVNIMGTAAAPFEIRYNEARGTGSSDHVGGGFYTTSNGTTTLVDSVLRNNHANTRGGGYFLSGGGKVIVSSSVASTSGTPASFISKIIDNSVTGAGTGDGAGFYQANATSLSDLTDVLISGNTAEDEGAGFINESSFSTVKLTSVDLTANSAADQGGGFYNRSNGSEVILDGVRIDGNVSDTEHGGGFRNLGRVTGQDVIISGNLAGKAGQTANNDTNYVGGGFYSSGGATSLVELTRVEITGNDSHGRGGGFYNAQGQVNLTDFILSGNTTDQGTNEGQGRGGGFWNSSGGAITLNRGEISENESFGHGGGFYQQDNGSSSSLTNVTISGNHAGVDQNGAVTHDTVGGGFWAISVGEVFLDHVTIAENQVNRNGTDAGAGFRVDTTGNVVTMANSIVFGNLRNVDAGPGIADDVDSRLPGGDLQLVGNNVIGISTGNALGGNTGGVTSADPGLFALADNGGAILPGGAAARTHALDIGNSSAIDAASGSTLSEDQRGAPRPQGAAEDLGAFESPGTIYVNDGWTGTNQGAELDGDLELAGTQQAFFGVSAFDSIDNVLSTYASFGGNIVVNGGTYASVNLTGGTLGDITLTLVRDLADTENDVTIAALTGDATDAIVTRLHNSAEADLVISGTSDFAGVISGTGELEMNAAGGTLTLTGANSYTGKTSINNGTILVDGATAAINATDSVEIAVGTLRLLNGSTVAVTNGVTNGAGTGNLQIDGGTMTVGSGLAADHVRVGRTASGIGAQTGSLTVIGGAVVIGNNSGNFDVGREESGGGAAQGMVDFTGASSVVIDVTNFRLGSNGGSNGNVFGTVVLSNAGNNTISATTATLGDSPSPGNTGVTSTLTLGANVNDLNINTFNIGQRKSQATVTIVSGGTLNLSGDSNAETDLFIGRNNAGTASDATGLLDLSGGIFNATLDQVFIGLHSSSSGSGLGTLTFEAGTVTANQLTLGDPIPPGSTNPLDTTGTLNQRGGSFTVANGVLDGDGTSVLNVDDGTFTVLAGGLSVDDLRVGFDGGNGILNVNAGDVRIGDGDGTFEIGRRASGSGNTRGTVSFANASSVTIDVTTLRMGTNTTGSGWAQGDLTLSQAGTNTVSATTLLMGEDVPGANQSAATSSDLHLGGGANNFHVDTMTVGGFKSVGTIDIAAGGALTLDGDANPETDLRIGYNNTGTGTNPDQSVMDLTGGTFNATLDALEIGIHGTLSGSGKGVLTYGAGTVTANSVTLAEPGAGTPANTEGTLNFGGDVLDLQGGDVIDGGGTPTFTFTGGTLKDVNSFGLALAQQGGILQVGADGAADNMAIAGNYTVTAGIFGATIAGNAGNGLAGGNDQVDVTGAVALGNGVATLSLDGAHVPVIGESYVIIDNDGSGDFTSGFFTGLTEGSAVNFNGVDLYITYNGGDGNDVVLNTVPEVNGTDAEDVLVVDMQANGDLQYQLNGGPVITLTMPTAFTFNGSGGDDHFQFNTNGHDLPLNGITFNGGGQSNVPNPTPNNGDVLSIDGFDHTQTAAYTPSATTPGDGTVEIDGRVITFTGLEPVDISGMLLATLSLPGADDIIDLANGFDAATGLVPAIVASGTSGGVAIESAHFFNNTTVRIDTTLVSDGNDTITVTGAGNAHANDNLIINTGTGTDTVTVNGAATFQDDITITTPDATINAVVTSTNNGTIGIESDAVDIAATVNAGTGRVEIESLTAGRDIHFGNTGLAGELNLSDAEVDFITAGVLQVGNATAGRILFSGTGNGGLITPANVDTVHLITDNFVDDGSNDANGGGIRVENLAIEVGGTALSGASNAVVLSNTNSGVRSDIGTVAIHSARGRILVTDYNHGIGTNGLIIGTVDGLSGVINNTNDPGTATADNDREEITINVTGGDLTITDTPEAFDVFARRDIVLQSSSNNRAVIVDAGAVLQHVEGGSLVLRGDNIDLNGNIDSPNRTVILRSDDHLNPINLGAADTFLDATLEIDQAEIDRITAQNITIGHVDYDDSGDPVGADEALGAGDITVTTAINLTNANDLRFQTNRTVSQTAGSALTGIQDFGIQGRGDVTLNESGNVFTNLVAIDLRRQSDAISAHISLYNSDVDWTIDSAAGAGNFMRTDNGDITITSDGTVRIDESATNADVEVTALTNGQGSGNITFNIGAGTTDGRDFITNDATDSNNDRVNIFADGNLAINLLGTGDSRIILNDSTSAGAGGSVNFDVLGSSNNAQIILHGGTTVDAGTDITFTVQSNNGQFITNSDDGNPVLITSTGGILTVDVDRWNVDISTVIDIAGQQMFISPFAVGDNIVLGVGTGTDTADGVLRINNDELNTVTGAGGTVNIGNADTGDLSVGGAINLPVNVVIANEGNAINIDNAVDSVNGSTLTLNNTGGTSTIAADLGAINALGSLTTDASGLTILNNGIGITTLGDQTYNDQLDVAGTGTPGLATLNAGAGNGLVFNTTSLFSVDLLNATAGTGHDQLVVNGTVTLNNADLDLNPLIGLAPGPGDEFILISNDGVDAVNGTFFGLAEGNIIALNLGGVASALFTISYQGGTLNNDVVLTALGVSATTDIIIDGSGNLVIKDIDENVAGGGTTGNSADNFGIRVEGSEVVITDPGNALGTLINGATQSSLSEVRVDVGLFTGDVIVNGLALGDHFTIGNLGASVLPMGLILNGGDGFDHILHTGDGSVLASGGSAEFNAEEIEFQFSDLTTTDGDITLNGTGGTGSNHQGIHLLTSDLSAGGTGSITLNGSGGDTGNSNQGVFLSNNSSVTTADGDIDIDGAGGGGVTGQGVTVFSGSSLSAGGDGNLTIDGTGGTTGTYQNEGVFFNSGTSASVAGGDMTITGTGGGTLGGGFGVSITNTTLSGSGAGNIIITGTSAATGGFNNGGVQLWATTVTTTGTGAGDGDVTISGSGAPAGTINNMGVRLSNVDVTAGLNGSIDIDGTGAGSGAGNIGVQLSADANLTVSGAGSIAIDGTGAAGSGTSSTNNDGVQMGPMTDLNFEDGDLTIDGTGGGSGATAGGLSQGVDASGITITGTGSGNVVMTGTGTGNGSGNQGIALSNSGIATTGGSGSITLNGTGSSAGLSNNEGVRLANTDLATGSNGSIDIDGQGGGTALGLNNSGVSLASGSTLDADGTGTIDIDGTGGSARLFTRGVFVTGVGSSISSGSGAITLTGSGAGSLSFNRGVELGYANVSTGGNVTLRGSGSTTGTGLFNQGVYILGLPTTGISAGGTLTIDGNGGTGTTFNEGVRIQGGALSGTLNLTGTANGATTGVYNSGVYLLGVNLGGVTGGSSIVGTGGGTTLGNFNHGIFMQGIVGGYGGSTVGAKGAGASSQDQFGNFF